MHTPVLLQEVIDGLDIRQGGRYIDATVGEGGHTRAMLGKGAFVLGIDQDAAQIEKLKTSISSDKFMAVCANFSSIEEVAKKQGFDKADGILFDLGISWRQLSEAGKGLSYKALDEELDMRLSTECEQSAADIVNTFSEDELYSVFAKNSEEIRSRDIARTIVEERKYHKIKKVKDLLRSIDKALGAASEWSYGRIFQALRIEVNDEFGSLEKGLEQAVRLIGPEGRIAVITFHSVEDRMVKRFIREGHYRQISKKAIAGDRALSFERSAKLRVFGI